MKNAITTIAVATTLAFGQAAFAQDSQQEWQAAWGEADQIGAANRMSAESIREAAKLVTAGTMYSRGSIVDKDAPACPPRSLRLTVLQPNQMGTSGLGDNAVS